MGFLFNWLRLVISFEFVESVMLLTTVVKRALLSYHYAKYIKHFSYHAHYHDIVVLGLCLRKASATALSCKH
jgi:hypothetical protein